MKTAAEGGFEVKRKALDWPAMSADARDEFEQIFGDKDAVSASAGQQLRRSSSGGFMPPTEELRRPIVKARQDRWRSASSRIGQVYMRACDVSFVRHSGH
ncbi:MAG: hypothetical protein ACSLEZ_10340 [Thiobacillus sp.]